MTVWTAWVFLLATKRLLVRFIFILLRWADGVSVAVGCPLGSAAEASRGHDLGFGKFKNDLEWMGMESGPMGADADCHWVSVSLQFAAAVCGQGG
ncbi:hypothetical protein F4780DRAFT_744682 [Xylariomycetidae sp. FL0641]|nr:hypothetical protein F4780DRAFT_744682 [Xylariomycetidae sp. FL0641]